MRVGSTKIISNDEGHILIERKRSTSSPWGTFVGTWQAERKPIQLMTRTKLQNHLSSIQYISNPNKTNPNKTDDKGNEPAIIQDQLALEYESPRSVQLEAKNDNSSEKGLSPSQPESRMGLSDAQSPLASRPPTNESEVPTVNKDVA